MARKRAGAAAGKISDDLLLEIFARLTGLLEILRCAATCKRWLRLATDRAFLRRAGLWPDTAPRPSVLVGIFSQNTIPCSRYAFQGSHARSPPQFFSLQAGGDGRLSLYSFLAADDAWLFNYARPLASRRGLLLLRVADRRFQLAVCRHMGGGKRSTHLLDMIGFRDHDFTGYALLTDEDYGDQQQQHSTYKVTLNYTDNYGFAYACTYSSATGSWSAPIKCSWQSALTMCGPRAGLVIGSVVHWLYVGKDKNFYTLSVNTTTAHVSLAKIPIKAQSSSPLSRPPIPCIAGEGMLSFVTVQQQDHGVLELWTKKHGEGNEGWQHSQLTDLGSKKINIAFFAESRGALLVKQNDVFITVDLKSKEKMLVDLKYENMGHIISGTSQDEESCSSSCCKGGHYGCPPTPPVHVLYELDWIFSRSMLLASSP